MTLPPSPFTEFFIQVGELGKVKSLCTTNFMFPIRPKTIKLAFITKMNFGPVLSPHNMLLSFFLLMSILFNTVETLYAKTLYVYLVEIQKHTSQINVHVTCMDILFCSYTS